MADIPRKIRGDLINHKNMIKTIGDLLYYNPNYNKFNPDIVNVLLYIKKDESYFKRKSTGDKVKAFQNLNNAWYNEAAFIDQSLSISDPYTKFLPWKIIKFYYSIFFALSAIVRCHDNTTKIGHKKMINTFTTICLRNKSLSNNFFISPYCFYLDKKNIIKPDPKLACSWSYGVSTHIPYLANNLLSLNDRPASIFHYFLDFRNWVNYSDSYIFRRLYGDTIKTDLYFSLNRILINFLLLCEIYFIWFFGYDQVKYNMDSFIYDFDKTFEKEMDVQYKSTRSLSSRLDYYEKYGSGFLY